jgi:hypothetical protein
VVKVTPLRGSDARTTAPIAVSAPSASLEPNRTPKLFPVSSASPQTRAIGAASRAPTSMARNAAALKPWW